MKKDTAKMTSYEYNGTLILVDENAEVWMTQKQMAQMLNISVQGVSELLTFALKNQHIQENSVINLPLKSTDGKVYQTKHYPLRAILLVGFRSKATKEAVIFQEWVTEIVRKHLSQHLEKRIAQLEDMLQGQQVLINTLRENAENNQNLLDHIQQLLFDAKMQAVPKALQSEVMETHLKKLQNHTIDEGYQRKLTEKK